MYHLLITHPPDVSSSHLEDFSKIQIHLKRMRRITQKSVILSVTIVTTILIILCAQILNSFQILIKSDLLENGEISDATPPRNMFEVRIFQFQATHTHISSIKSQNSSNV